MVGAGVGPGRWRLKLLGGGMGVEIWRSRNLLQEKELGNCERERKRPAKLKHVNLYLATRIEICIPWVLCP